MRVVLDTNILLGALITPGGTPDRIYRAWRAGRFDLVTSSEQLEELKRASRYPKLKVVLPAHRAGTMINNLRRSVVTVAAGPLPAGIELRDPHDAFLLTIAIAGEADCLVTGDRRAGLLQLGSVGRVRMMTPAEFGAAFL